MECGPLESSNFSPSVERAPGAILFMCHGSDRLRSQQGRGTISRGAIVWQANLATLRVSATLVVVGVVVGEFVGSSAGLGYLVLRAAGTINTPLLFAALGLMVFIGLLLSGLVGISERLATPWRFRHAPAH